MKTMQAAAMVSLAGLALSAAHAQDRNFNVADGQWNVANNWAEGSVPTAANNAYIEGGRRARIGDYAAMAAYLRLGYDTRGTLFQNAGSMTVSTITEVGGRSNSAQGYYEISGSGSLTTKSLYIGRDATGSGMNYSSSQASTIQEDAYVGGRQRGFFTQNNGLVRVQRDLSLGNFAGGRGEWWVRNGTTSIGRDAYIGWANKASGQLRIEKRAEVSLAKTMYVGQFGVTNDLQGEVINNGLIFASDANARIVVQGSKARMTGTGMYNVKVRYESDKIFGNANQSVAVEFASGVLKRSNRFSPSAGLTTRTGNAAARTAVTGASLPGTSVNINWGDADSPLSTNYNNVVATKADYTTIQSSFKPADVQGITGISAANLKGRVRLMQIGQRRWNAADTELSNTSGQIVNLTTSVDAATGVVIGKTADVYGSSDTTIIGKAVQPKAQDPTIESLHTTGDKLTGAGVLIGQLEPGLPDFDFGCFEDFTKASGLRASRNGAAAGTSAHATRVASIMTGYDPFGLQVDQQGRLVTAANGYGPDAAPQMGFVGVAPGAALRSRSSSTGSGSAADVDGICSATDAGAGDMKIVNMSAGYLQSRGAANPRGTTVFERAIDRNVEAKHIVWVQAAGNDALNVAGGPNGTLAIPAGAYNSIAVGNVVFDDPSGGVNIVHPTHFGANHAAIRLTSSQGPTADGRGRIDLVAQGVSNLDAFGYEGAGGLDQTYGSSASRGLYSTQKRLSDTSAPRGESGTSFAAPTVAGVAALMVDEARNHMHLPPAEDPRVIKSVLQTSADKPADWTKGRGAADAGNTHIPLSYTYGAGVLDPVGAVNLLKAGLPDNTQAITGDGWYWTNLMNEDTTGQRGKLDNGAIGVLTGDAYILKSVMPDTPLTMTLNWYSHVDATNTRSALDNIFLQLYEKDNTGIWQPLGDLRSDSTLDNLQHVWTFANAFDGGDILARVWSPNMIPAAIGLEAYALSWQFTSNVPTPGAIALLGLGSFFAARRRRD
ncbi:MAG: hypothetical protein GC200_05865 [Tepidisphaera sp.]|nr:hypothetical protein [Tepidisphaera sp.]